MTYPITRRQAIAGLSALMALPALTACQTRQAAQTPFHYGVASGDPDQTSVVIWTHISTTESNATVKWQIARDADFQHIVQQGDSTTNASRDFTVKVLIQALAAGETYFYRFSYDGHHSTVGRSKTLPNGHVAQIGIALASCSNYPFGHFNAYDAIAKDAQVDVVLHLGDYIYEYGANGWGSDTGQQLGRIHEPAGEIISLADYRQRHAQYKSDLGSQNMHAAHPLIPIWDDHESTNNPWMGGAQNHQTATEGPWNPRRDASLQAYYEWMPIREPSLGMSRAQYWRHFEFGDLASMISLETRHTGRALQIDYADHIANITDTASRDHFMANILGETRRNMLSTDMEQFLSAALGQANAQKRPWKIIANQIPMARTHVPSMEHPFFKQLIKDPNDPVAAEWATMAKQGQFDLPIYLDTWDGYPAARERFYQRCRQAGVSDLIVLTGDSHAFWQNQLFDGHGNAMGVELGTTGISSPGDFLRLGQEGAELLDGLVANHNPEVIWTENRYNGYVKLLLTHEKAQADFIKVSTVLNTDYTASVVKSVDIIHTEQSLSYL